MEYEDIVQWLITNKKITEHTPEGVNISPLCIGMLNGKVADCFLVSESVMQHQERFKCKIRAVVEEKSQIELEVQEIDGQWEEEISEKALRDREAAGKRYMKLYSEIKKFAFAPALTQEERNMLEEFMKNWKGAVEEGIREKAEKSFTEFFLWEQNARNREVQDEQE